MASGMLASFMSVGAAGGAMLSGPLVEWVGWRWMFAIYSLPGFLWALWFYWWFRDNPADHPGVNPAELGHIESGSRHTPCAVRPGSENRAFRTAGTRNPSAPSADGETPAPVAHEPTPWLAIFTSWPMWCICGQQFCRAAGYIFYTTWFTTYLIEARGLPQTEASFLTSLPLWAVVAGSPLGGVISDWLLARSGSRRISRQWLACASMAACAVLILLAFRIEHTPLAVTVIAAGSLCSAIGGPTSYAITMDMGGRHVATVFSTMNMAGNLAAVLFPLLVPYLIKWSGNWDLVFYTFAGVDAGAALCWIMFDPRGNLYE
jgi:MFS family permease